LVEWSERPPRPGPGPGPGHGREVGSVSCSDSGLGFGSKLGDQWNMIPSESKYSDREVRVIMVDKITMDRLVRLRAGRVGM